MGPSVGGLPFLVARLAGRGPPLAGLAASTHAVHESGLIFETQGLLVIFLRGNKRGLLFFKTSPIRSKIHFCIQSVHES